MRRIKPVNNYAGLADNGRTLPMLGAAALTGVGAGLIASAYRFVLSYAEEVCLTVYKFIDAHLFFVIPAFALLAGLGFFTGFLLSNYKFISGSGIPQVKGTLTGQFEPAWRGTVIAKFIGGAVAMFAGLSLGREGPSIQFGASAGQGIGEKLAKTRYEKRALIAGGAGAGLAAAFNAPLSGVMFTIEELYKYISPLILLTAMVSAVAADAVARLIFGSAPVFNFTVIGAIPISQYWILIVTGLALGAAGAFYNKALLFSIRLFRKIRNVKYRAIPAYIAAGALGLIFPAVIGSGHSLINGLTLSSGFMFLCSALIFKFILSLISYGCGAPGGIFFPLLVMGAAIGAILAKIFIGLFGLDDALFINLVILSMTGFFTAIVRAPITGITLLVEMTGSFDHLLPLSIVALTAFAVAELLKSEPIYESLLNNMAAGGEKPGEDNADKRYATKKITIEMIVQFDSPADNKRVSELRLPGNCLMIAIKRQDREFIPKGGSVIMAGDYLTFLADLNDEAETRKKLSALTKGENKT